METRGLSQWREIVDQQKTSELNIKDFCQHNNINLKTFYNRRAKLGLSPPPKTKAFVKATPVKMSKPQSLLLSIGSATLSLPQDTDPQWVAQLLQAIAS